ncbi:hypothetical protein HOV93_18180 [Planctomycetes bacterium FF15]|uniref:Uncharacterized protein n=1 Tax=Bremerella alba TaxID=980252 RepID=A0A7V9A6U0_9BACT|nr:hypothetical protein [Bremerella alba]
MFAGGTRQFYFSYELDASPQAKGKTAQESQKRSGAMGGLIAKGNACLRERWAGKLIGREGLAAGLGTHGSPDSVRALTAVGLGQG